jgi:hypothetical protein
VRALLAAVGVFLRRHGRIKELFQICSFLACALDTFVLALRALVVFRVFYGALFPTF